jgi:hypothetical protein
MMSTIVRKNHRFEALGSLHRLALHGFVLTITLLAAIAALGG